MNSHIQRINRNLIAGWMIIVLVLLVAYVGEVVKGQRSVAYLIAYMSATMLPALLALLLYLRKPDRYNLRYFIVVGYFIMYWFSMLSGNTTMVFSYILPMLSLLVLYHQPKLILITGAAALVLNLYSIYQKVVDGSMTMENSKDAEIQIALIVLCFLGSYMATNIYDSITRENAGYVKMLDEKNAQIQKISLQTITTIANAIDAKDDFTRGHSRRVSEYAAGIAKELGWKEEEIENLRAIALLHDIGKIGIPDAVLNKPEKLTREEYEIMKQHTLIGEEILKDFEILPDIASGAKYHHERYDGKGYPEGIQGEDIPISARVIAVADAFDAMTSNRVYRKALNQDRVMEELNRGIGTQFDPKMASALIRLINDGKIEMSLKWDLPSEDVSEALGRVKVLQGVLKSEDVQFDELTGAYTQTCGRKLLQDMMDTNFGSLFLVDIDHFRQINEEKGFVVGDTYLKATANLLRELTKDSFVTRWGGDEFVLFAAGITGEVNIRQLAGDFDTYLKQMKIEDEKLKDLSLSIGIAVHDKSGDSLTEILRKADLALYHAKRQGEGSYFIYEDSEPLVSTNVSKIDLERLKGMIQHEGEYNGAFGLNYPGFVEIFEFVRKVAERNKQPVQLMLFTLQNASGTKIDVENRDYSMGIMGKVISHNIRGVDVTTKYSSSQWLVMFMNLSREQISLVTDRIMMEFYRVYDKNDLSIHYDVVEITDGIG